MSPVTHFLISWSVALSANDLERRERAMIAVAGIAPDIDGFGYPVEVLTRNSENPLLWFSDYHHVLAHNIVFCGILAAGAYALAKNRRLLTMALVFLTSNLHLICDILGSKGPDGHQWPVPYFAPFVSQGYVWSQQWPLASWQNMVVTVIAMGITLYASWRYAVSPLEIVSQKVNDGFVGILRKRFGEVEESEDTVAAIDNSASKPEEAE